MNEMYRDEARVEHMNRAIQKIQKHLPKVSAGNFVEGNDDVERIWPDFATNLCMITPTLILDEFG